MQPTRRVLYALMLAAASGLAACDRPEGDLTGPAVQQDLLLDGGSTMAAGGRKSVEFLSRTSALTGDITYATTEPVGKWGAVLNFGTHRLLVPTNAVSRPTYFSATLRAGSEIRFDLRAWDENGVPVTKFSRQVQLTISLADASKADLNGVAVFYLNPNGAIEQMPSSINTKDRSVTGFLDHFSDYIPGTLRNDPPPPQIEP